MMRAVVRFVGVIAFAATVSAVELHVAPGGGNDNPVTKEKPFATIAAARDAARVKGGAGHSLLLASGSYFHAAAIIFDDRDSGLLADPDKEQTVTE